MTEEIRLTTEVLNCDYFNRNRGFNCYKGKNCTEVPDCYYRQLKRLEQENKELKKEIQFHNKENSNLLAERNAAQIGYDEIREVRERYRSALEEIREIAYKGADVNDCNFCYRIFDKINEVLQ